MVGLMLHTDAIFQTKALVTDLDRIQRIVCSVKAARHDTSMAACLSIAIQRMTVTAPR
jgi:hypothetical protein